MLTIAANLLPPEIVEARRGRVVRRIVVSAVALFTVLLGGWFGVATYQTSLARGELSGAQGDVDRLSRQQRPFTELIKVQNESKAIGGQLSDLLANDLQWAQLLSSLRGAAPAGVQLTSVTGGLTATSGSSAGTPRLPDTSGQKLIGSLTVNGSAPGKPAVAGYVDALAKVQGLGNPMLESVNENGKAVTFTLRVDITAAALGGRYTSPSPSASKGR
jgi:Tfp pilus assembly protein PilN